MSLVIRASECAKIGLEASFKAWAREMRWQMLQKRSLKSCYLGLLSLFFVFIFLHVNFCSSKMFYKNLEINKFSQPLLPYKNKFNLSCHGPCAENSLFKQTHTD